MDKIEGQKRKDYFAEVDMKRTVGILIVSLLLAIAGMQLTAVTVHAAMIVNNEGALISTA